MKNGNNFNYITNCLTMLTYFKKKGRKKMYIQQQQDVDTILLTLRCIRCERCKQKGVDTIYTI